MPGLRLWCVVCCVAFPALVYAQNLPFGISLPPSVNFAASPNPVGSGARAVGKGTAFIGVADDATAASHNPGGLIQLERPEVSIVGSYRLTVEDPDVFRPDTIVAGQTLDAFRLDYLSAVYPFQLLRRNMVVSLNVQRLYDLQSVVRATSRYTTLDGIQEVRSRQKGALYTISPALAVQLTPTLSVGAALNIWPDLFGNGWEQDVTVRGTGRVVSGNSIVPFVSEGRLREKFTFEGVNVTAGFFWTINSVFTLGGVFRSPFTAQVTHTHSSSLSVTLQNGAAPVGAQRRFRESLEMDLPMSYGLGLSARLSDSLTVSLDVSRTHWSDFRREETTQDNTLVVDNGAPAGRGRAVLRGQSDDVTSVRLGTEYLWLLPKSALAFRGGVFYDPEPSDGRPDDFFGFSLGSGIAINRFLFDVAYTFRTGTVSGEAADTGVSQHTILSSIIYHF